MASPQKGTKDAARMVSVPPPHSTMLDQVTDRSTAVLNFSIGQQRRVLSRAVALVDNPCPQLPAHADRGRVNIAAPDDVM